MAASTASMTRCAWSRRPIPTRRIVLTIRRRGSIPGRPIVIRRCIDFPRIDGAVERRKIVRSLTNPARSGPEQGAFEVIPCDRIQGGRDQFPGFRCTTPVLNLEPLGFLNIIDREFAQPADLGTSRNWISRRKQPPGATAAAFISQPAHQRLLGLWDSFETVPGSRFGRT